MSPRLRSLWLVAIVVMLVGLAATGASQRANCDRQIANVSHDGIHFTLAIAQDGHALEIRVPEKIGVEPRPLWIRLRFRNESVIEGAPARQPSVGSGGYVDWQYRFDAKRAVEISQIFAVTLRVGDQSFDVMPW